MYNLLYIILHYLLYIIIIIHIIMNNFLFIIQINF